MEGSLFFHGKREKRNNQMKKELINAKTMFSVRKRYMKALALCRNRNMIQEEMAVWMHAEMKGWN